MTLRLKHLALALLAFPLLACGYSEQEWQQQLDKYGRLDSQRRTEQEQAAAANAQLQSELELQQRRVDLLEKKLRAAGIDLGKLSTDLDSKSTEVSKLNADLEQQRKALAEYKARAAQLERIRARFEKLRSKLDALVSLGLEVQIRNNRMIISLPGDVLFASGRDSLKKGGEDILAKVSKIINQDAGLRGRYYQVAGHTDNRPFSGGAFKDNWGLSLMRAREVLIYLIDPKKGGLPKKQWSAAGFGDTDPVAANDSADGRQKNRRCELVVIPNAEEMLDLKAIAQ